MAAEKELEVLLIERDRITDALKKLEEDHRSGKISKLDYEVVSERYEIRLKEINQKLGIAKAEATRERKRGKVVPPRKRKAERERVAPPHARKPKPKFTLFVGIKEKKTLFPLATLILFLLNVAIFVLAQGYGYQAIYDYGMRPAAVLSGEAVHGVLTSAFMHGDGWHLISNMIFLLLFGIILERRIGTPKFLVIYFLTHFAASAFDLAIRPSSTLPGVGASAAIMGMMGACFLGYPMSRAPLGLMIWIVWPLVSLFLPGLIAFIAFFLIIIPVILLTLTKFVVIWPFVMAGMVAQMISGVLVAQRQITWGVNYWAHITGFLAGMLLILVLKPGEEEAKPRGKS